MQITIDLTDCVGLELERRFLPEAIKKAIDPIEKFWFSKLLGVEAADGEGQVAVLLPGEFDWSCFDTLADAYLGEINLEQACRHIRMAKCCPVIAYGRALRWPADVGEIFHTVHGGIVQLSKFLTDMRSEFALGWNGCNVQRQVVA